MEGTTCAKARSVKTLSTVKKLTRTRQTNNYKNSEKLGVAGAARGFAGNVG